MPIETSFRSFKTLLRYKSSDKFDQFGKTTVYSFEIPTFEIPPLSKIKKGKIVDNVGR